MDVMNPTQTAEYMGVSLKTLQRWRNARVGPPFRRIGDVIRYSRHAVDGWLASDKQEEQGR